MTTPRSREEIEKHAVDYLSMLSGTMGLGGPYVTAAHNRIIIELLCDIRDLLTKKNPTDPSHD